jgi:hypothetical protein
MTTRATSVIRKSFRRLDLKKITERLAKFLADRRLLGQDLQKFYARPDGASRP